MGFINRFKVKKSGGTETEYDIVALSAQTAGNTNAIGNVEKYSFVDDKTHEGLRFVNNDTSGLIELNSKGNLAVESLSKHLNLESAKGIQIKPTTNVIIDSSRRLFDNKGNEIQIEVKFDDFGDSRYNGKDGYDEQWAELKVNSRNLDLRCHDHGGIALQTAGHDGIGFENKIKFESSRTCQIGVSNKTYTEEGGKGLEFGTFNNEHASLFCGDYRFKGDANVYGVTRDTPFTNSKGKYDYPTQADDFKDVLDQTKVATWNDIIDAGKKCKNLETTVANEVARQALSASGIDVSGFVTRDNVEEIVASAMSDANIDLTGVATEAWVIEQNYLNSLPDGLQYVGVGNSKGNFQIDVTGKYTWELTSPKSATTIDEFGNPHEKGDRVINYSNEAFYQDPNKVYYKAVVETTLADNTTVVPIDTIVYTSECNLTFNVPDGAYQYYLMGSGEESFYEDPTKYVYQGTKNISIAYGETTPIKKKAIKNPNDLTQEELAYYDSQTPEYDEEGALVAGWEKTPIWKKSPLWTMNEININFETDSKIKFAGKKIETVWTYDDVDHKMDDILLSTNTLSTDANEVVFEQKISKNGDRSGQDTELVYTYSNNVSDTEKVADFAAFKANYDDKHKNHTKTNEELQAMYDAFVAEGQSFEIRVKVSDLLGLVAKVAALEARIEALEGGNTPEPEEPGDNNGDE